MAKTQTTIKGVTVAEMLAEAKKDMGEGVGQIGGEYEECERIPTGIFEFDIATGGGFPKNRASLIWGNESSGKTLHAILAIANHQRLWPDKTCAYVALEGYNDNDKRWFRSLGVDVDKLAVFKPLWAEQVVDVIDSFMWSSDAGLIVLDSIAVMMVFREFEESAEKKSFGGSAIPINSLYRKVSAAFDNAPSKPTIIYINQPRTKVGVSYGDPTTLPGGPGINYFHPSMIVKLYGKDLMDTKFNKVVPVRKEVTMTLTKKKLEIRAKRAEYEIVIVPHNNLTPGRSNWFNSFKAYAEAMGDLHKGEKGKGWVCYGAEYNTLQEIKDEMYGDPDIQDKVVAHMLDKLAENPDLIAAVEDD